MIAKVIAERPEDIRDYMAKEVKKKKMNPKATYFAHKDFDALFENYNILNGNAIPIMHLFQGNKNIKNIKLLKKNMIQQVLFHVDIFFNK